MGKETESEHSPVVSENVPLLEIPSQNLNYFGSFEKILEAVYTGNESELVKLLRDPTVTPHILVQQDLNGYTPLHYTTFKGPCDRKQKGIQKILAKHLLDYYETRKLDKSILLTKQDGNGNTALHHAAQYKQFDLVSLFLESGNDPLVKRGISGPTPVHLMADGKGTGALLSFKQLLTAVENSQRVNMDHFVFDVGRYAATSGAEKILKYLIEEKKLNLEHTGTLGLSVVHLCILGNQKYSDDFLKSLLTQVGNQVARNPNKDSLLHLAARVSNAEVMELMASQGHALRNIDVKNAMGETPFHCAVYGFDEKSIKCFKILLRIWKSIKLPKHQLEDLMARDNEGQTVFTIACENKAAELVEFLVNIRVDDMLPYPWFDSNTLAEIYSSFPVTLLPLMNEQIKLPPPDGTKRGSQEVNKISLNFEAIVGYSTGSDFRKTRLNDSTALYGTLSATKSDRDKVLVHPLVKSFLLKKWEKLKWLALLWFFLQIVLVLSYYYLTVSLYGDVINSTETESDQGDQDQNTVVDILGAQIASGIVSSLLIISFLKEVFQIISHRCLYFQSPLNWFQLVFICIVTSVIVDGFRGIRRDFSVQVGFAAFGSFLSVFLLVRDLGRLVPGCERFFEVLIKVIQSSTKVLLFYLPCLVAFTLAFRILMKKNNQFQLPYGFVKIFSMAVGELDYETVFTVQGESESLGIFIQLMFLLLAFLAAIVLINLLIAFAVSDIQSLLIDAETTRLASQLKLIYGYEHFLRMVAHGTGAIDFFEKFYLDSLSWTVPLEDLSQDLGDQLRNIIRLRKPAFIRTPEENEFTTIHQFKLP